MARVDHCKFREGPCDDPECQLGACVWTGEVFVVMAPPPPAPSLLEEIERTIEHCFHLKGHGKPSQHAVHHLREHPQIVSAAKKSLER